MSLIRFTDDVDFPRSFSKMIDEMMNETAHNGGRRFSPSVDISETEKHYDLMVNLPGMKKEDIKLEVDGQNLMISGERHFEKEDKGRKFHRVESQHGKFSRSFTLPEEADLGKIEAKYNDGVLNVNIPKNLEKAAVKKIDIK